MDEMKKNEVTQKIKDEWKNTKKEKKIVLAKDLHDGYIFGEYANNEHYNIDEFVAVTKSKNDDEQRIKGEIKENIINDKNISLQDLIDSLESEWDGIDDILEEMMEKSTFAEFKTSVLEDNLT